MRSVGVVAFLTILAATVACRESTVEGTPTLWAGPQADGVRDVHTPEWQDVWHLGEGDEPLLARPRLLTAGDSIAVWWDDYLHHVAAVDARDGRLLWLFGREGNGPDEFRDVGDLRVDRDGAVVVLDSDNRRLTRISPQGRRLSLTPLPDGYWRGLAPQPDGSWIISGNDPERPFLHLASDGTTARRFPVPWEDFSRLSYVQRQGRVVASPDGRWIFAFLLGNGWFPHRGVEALSYVGQSIEHMAFPAVVVTRSRGERVTALPARTNCGLCEGTIRGDTLMMLFGGPGRLANSVLDQYRWDDGTYLGSVILPQPATGLAMSGDILLLNVASLEPRIQAFRRSTPPL